MRIKRCRIEAFGGIEELELEDLDSSSIVFLGPNEAGKSTLFEFFKTMLYGIYPTVADKHPYAPWTGRRLQGDLTFETGKGETKTVSRRLLSSPEGKLLNGKNEVLRNQTVPSARHISADLFDAVYALSLSDLTAIQEKPWTEVQDRLLGSFEQDKFRPTRVILSELESEAGFLWRESKRGNQKSRDVEKRILELRDKARKAGQRDKRVRTLNREISEIQLRSSELENRKAQHKEQRGHLNKLVPIKNLLERIELNREIAADFGPYQDLPENLGERLTEGEEKVQQLQLSVQKKSKQKTVLSEQARLSEEDSHLLKIEPEIRTRLSKRGNLQELRNHLTEIQEELQEARVKFSQLREKVGAKSEEIRLETDLRQLSIDRLRASLQEYTQQKIRYQKELSSRDAEWKAVPLPLLLSGTAALFGILMTLYGLFYASVHFVVPAALVGSLGITALTILLLRRKRIQKDNDLALEQQKKQLGELRDQIAEGLGTISTSIGSVEKLDPYLLNDLHALQDSLYTRDVLQEKYQSQLNRIKQFENETETWIQSEGLQSGDSSEITLEKLETRLKRTLGKHQQAEAARAQLGELSETLDAIREDLSSHLLELEEVKKLVVEAGEGSLSQGIQVLESRRRAFEEAERYRAVLEGEYPDWQQYRSELEKSDNSAITAESLEQAEERIEEIDAELKTLSSEKASKEQELVQLESLPSVSDIESEIAFLESELENIRFERDRLKLLAEIVREGEREFRERHQPDVLRRASKYLREISSGRYLRMDFNQDDEILEVVRNRYKEPLPVNSPLSSGTRDQIFLSLRLALVEHLDDGRERLPLFLDEIFVNWDPKRRRDGFRILDSLLDSRQIVFFTCHEWFADEAKDHLQTRVIPFDLRDEVAPR